MAQPDSSRHDLTAAELLTPVWRSQVDELRRWEAALREQHPDAVHQFRVVTRRLRSGLAGFAPLVDDRSSRTITRELGRTAAVVGRVRDVQAIRARLDPVLKDHAGAGMARLRGRLLERLDQMGTESWQRSLEHLDHADYDDLTRRLERFADLPPWLPTADRRADDVLRPILRSEWTRFRASVHQALEEQGSKGEGSLHQTRKDSKRARYVAESLVDLFGRNAKRLGKASKQVQTVLGRQQDSKLVRDFLVEARLRLPLDRDEADAVDAIQRAELSHLALLRGDIELSLRRADRKSLRAWMQDHTS